MKFKFPKKDHITFRLKTGTISGPVMEGTDLRRVDIMLLPFRTANPLNLGIQLTNLSEFLADLFKVERTSIILNFREDATQDIVIFTKHVPEATDKFMYVEDE